jgi:muramoyltetrapeptide carboxypeptidase
MNKIYPDKLKAGDEVRVIAPARSLAMISAESRQIADARLADLGLNITFGKHVEEADDFVSSSIASRVEDIHDAFRDPKVKAILTVIGGFNSNQLLRYLDWELIRNNPKILCGYSDITILNNAFYAKTGLVSYSGPHYSSFGQRLDFDYTLEYFKKCIMEDAPFAILPSQQWSDDAWYKDQQDRKLLDNLGYLLINEGEASGTLVGANLGTLRLLQGTEYWPDLTDSILFIEDDEESRAHHFDRELQALIHSANFSGVRGIVIGRFQKASEVTDDLLMQIIKSKKELDHLPVIANVDFGHTDPKVSFPIGGEVKLVARPGAMSLEILRH